MSNTDSCESDRVETMRKLQTSRICEGSLAAYAKQHAFRKPRLWQKDPTLDVNRGLSGSWRSAWKIQVRISHQSILFKDD